MSALAAIDDVIRALGSTLVTLGQLERALGPCAVDGRPPYRVAVADRALAAATVGLDLDGFPDEVELVLAASLPLDDLTASYGAPIAPRVFAIATGGFDVLVVADGEDDEPATCVRVRRALRER